MTFYLLPQKHVRASESVLGLGAIVLLSLSQGSKNLDAIWNDVKTHESVKRSAHGAITLDSVILAVDFLFAVGAVKMSRDGVIINAPH